MEAHSNAFNNIAMALRVIRRARGYSQEDFSSVSSRTYISSLERGTKSPTLGKVEQIATALNVHPLTLLAISFATSPSLDDVSVVLAEVQKEVAALGLPSGGGG